MSIKHAILGLLSWKPATGYDLKKVFEESSAMYWSGNNNQIYKSLLQLLDEGLATSEVQHQEGSPSRKIYTLTPEGVTELRDWVLSAPEPPEFRKTFLIQLAWSDQLTSEELDGLFASYENEIKMQILMQQEKGRRGIYSPQRTPRETLLWDLISENLISSFQNELNWVQKVRGMLLDNGTAQEVNQMNCKVIEHNDGKYLECISAERLLGSEKDALELVALCGENDTNLLLLHGAALAEDFFKLKTGVAGEMLQKFINYRVQTAAVISKEQAVKGRFKEMIAESNKGNHFRVFDNRTDAEAWLLSRK